MSKPKIHRYKETDVIWTHTTRNPEWRSLMFNVKWLLVLELWLFLSCYSCLMFVLYFVCFQPRSNNRPVSEERSDHIEPPARAPPQPASSSLDNVIFPLIAEVKYMLLHIWYHFTNISQIRNILKTQHYSTVVIISAFLWCTRQSFKMCLITMLYFRRDDNKEQV